MIATSTMDADIALAEKAATKKSPLSGTIEFILEDGFEYGSDTAINDLVFETEALLKYTIADHLNITTAIVLEQIDSGENNKAYFFYKEGIALDYLLLNYTGDNFGFYGGRFQPNVYSFTYLPDLEATDLVEDEVEITDKLGFGGYVDIKSKEYGTHRIEASLFTADTTVLSETLITNSGGVSRSDGGVGNTEGLESFAVAIHGGNIPSLDGVVYHIGFFRQKADLIFDSDDVEVTDIADEYTVRIALQKEQKVSKDTKMTYLADYIHVWNSNGFDGATRDYLSGSLSVTKGKWTGAVAATYLWVDNEDTVAANNYQVETSVGYNFDSELTLTAGWTIDRFDGSTTREFFAELSKTLEF